MSVQCPAIHAISEALVKSCSDAIASLRMASPTALLNYPQGFPFIEAIFFGMHELS